MIHATDIKKLAQSPILIVDICGRVLASAAHKAEIPVYVLDVFHDTDTQACALASRAVTAHGAYFDAADLLTAAQRLCPPDTPLVYGAGFENSPSLLQELAADRVLYGNSPELFAQLTNPAYFFPLLKKLGIPHPETAFDQPLDAETTVCDEDGWINVPQTVFTAEKPRWLTKDSIHHYCEFQRTLSPDTKISCIGQRYYQRRLRGTLHSALFLADGHTACIIGYTEKWHNKVVAGTPYVSEGAVSVQDMPLQAEIAEVIQTLVAETGIKGLCSLEMLLNASGFHVLELIPRPSVTMELHEVHGNLFYWHLQACQGVLPAMLRQPSGQRAYAIAYANHSLRIPEHPKWPAWTANHPSPNTTIEAGDPVCMVVAQGLHSQQRVQQQRQQHLHYLLKDWRVEV